MKPGFEGSKDDIRSEYDLASMSGIKNPYAEKLNSDGKWIVNGKAEEIPKKNKEKVTC